MFTCSKSIRPLILGFALVGGCLAAADFAVEKPHSWPPDQFRPVTAERIAGLPTAEQAEWKAYLEVSRVLASKMPAQKASEFSSLQPLSGPPRGGEHTYGLRLNAASAWYASEEARVTADRVAEAQNIAGAWRKGMDYARPHAQAGHKPDLWSNGTFDNDATILEMRFLALVCSASPGNQRSDVWRSAFLRGLHYCFAAQYPNGGFPQVYPLVGGYHDNITYNDGAMTHVLELFRDIAQGSPQFSFVPSDERKEAALRLGRAIRCVLATQIKNSEGQLSAWGQQYDALSLKPAAARNFEPIAACSAESAELARLLMSLPKPSPEVINAVDAAVAWLGKVAIQNTIWTKQSEGRHTQVSPGAPLLWARFYEIGTDKPIFGDRDRTVHYVVEEISTERRDGYGWYGDWPKQILPRYQSWKTANASLSKAP
jgi:PelA/Pel-15E family pectate lyase